MINRLKCLWRRPIYFWQKRCIDVLMHVDTDANISPKLKISIDC